MSLEGTYSKATLALSSINDKAIDIVGESVVVVVPDNTSRDIYGTVTVNGTDEFSTKIIPDWNAFRFMLDDFNSSEEWAELPLTATAKVSDILPEGTLVKFTNTHHNIAIEYNTFRITKNEIKSTKVPYYRKLTMVPHRGDHY